MRLTLTEKFVKEILNITEPELFVGVARILKVPLFNIEEKKEREFGDVFADCIDAFEKENRKRQKELLSILKDANRCKENVDGYSTENSAEANPNKEM